MQNSEHFLFLENRNSDKLIIFFSSASAVRFEGFKALQKFEANKILIKDTQCGWYNGNIEGVSENADDLCRKLEHVVRPFRKENITVSGSSMGGYAALLFGSLLEAGRIIAIAPQTKLHPDTPFSPREHVKYSHLGDILQKERPGASVDIWFGIESMSDLYHILDCARFPGIKLYPLKNTMHDIFPALESQGLREAFFSYLAGEAEPPRADIAVIDGIDADIIHKAVTAFYIEKNYQKVIDILLPVSEVYNLSAIYYFIGFSYAKLKEYDKARKYLRLVTEKTPIHHEAHYRLALIHYLNKAYATAERGFIRAIKNNSLKSALYYYRLGATQKRLGKTEEAVSSFLSSLELDPAMSNAHKQLSEIYNKKSHYHRTKYTEMTMGYS